VWITNGVELSNKKSWREYNTNRRNIIRPCRKKELGPGQEDKWSRRKVDQMQPTNPDMHSQFLHWTRIVPTKTRDTFYTNTSTKENIIKLRTKNT
jgi:hypothetical protein